MQRAILAAIPPSRDCPAAAKPYNGAMPPDAAIDFDKLAGRIHDWAQQLGFQQAGPRLEDVFMTQTDGTIR